MKITFQCSGCGKTLKARPDAVGRTRKCPVCATPVTCPEPVVAARFVDAGVVDAEVLEAEIVAPAARSTTAARRDAGVPGPGSARPFNPYADVDDDPYQLAGPAPVTESSSDGQKPCPMCGEMILDSAVKCRFCGETFDSKLKKVKSKNRRKSSGGESMAVVGRDIGIGLVLMAVGIGATIYSYQSASAKGGGRYFIYHGFVIGGFIQFCRGIYNAFH